MNPSLVGRTNQKRYVLVTAAYNEEAYINNLLRSVVSQTRLPERWVVISDGSTDRTDAIVQKYSEQYSFIRLHRILQSHRRSFAAQVHAMNTGFAQLRNLAYDYIGNLDGDVSFEPDYFEQLIEKFERDPVLGLAGGMIYEDRDGRFTYRKSNNVRSVALAVQLFRRQCFESLGGYLPLRYGGPDWHAEIVARMRGWRVEAFPDLRVDHHRPTGSAGGLVRYCYLQGLMDYSFGSLPVFELFKCIRRLQARPYGLGTVSRLIGFLWASCRRQRRPVSDEFVRFLRAEQRGRLRSSLMAAYSRIGKRCRVVSMN